MKKALLIISLLGVLASCSNNGSTYDNRSNTPNYTNNNNSNYSDSNISGRVADAIRTDSSLSSDGRNVGVSTNNGVVTLTGTVPTRDEARYIERKVKSINGVRAVNNQLSIYP